MSQDNRFDEVVKAIAGGMSRRDVLRLIGAGLAGSVLASLGLGEARAATPAARNCVDFCRKQGLKGKALRDCVRECRQDCTAACQGLKGDARRDCVAACKSCGGDATSCGDTCCDNATEHCDTSGAAPQCVPNCTTVICSGVCCPPGEGCVSGGCGPIATA